MLSCNGAGGVCARARTVRVESRSYRSVGSWGDPRSGVSRLMKEFELYPECRQFIDGQCVFARS